MVTVNKAAAPAADERGPNIRLLKGIVIGLGVLIVLLLVGMIATVALRSNRPGIAAGSPAGPFNSRSVALPEGANVVEMVATGDRVVLRVKLADGGERFLFVDPRTGIAQGSLDLVPGK